MDKTRYFILKIVGIISLAVLAYFLFSIAPYYKPTETFEKGLAVMTDVIEIIENARKAAGIIFPGDSL